MRLRRLFVVMLSLLTLAACARQVPRYAAAPQGAIASSELDMRMYGAPQPASYAVRRVAQVVPVAATFEDGPYTLDAGDRLRIVVFGQDNLSNTYIVGAAGAIRMPLLGAPGARPDHRAARHRRRRPAAACFVPPKRLDRDRDLSAVLRAGRGHLPASTPTCRA